MEEYSYETRRKLINNYEKEWALNNVKIIEKNEKLINGIEKEYYNRDIESEKIKEEFVKDLLNRCNTVENNMNLEKPSNVFKEYYGEIIGIYVEEKYKEGFYNYIDKLNQFSYSVGYYRPMVRSKKYRSSKIYEIFGVMKNFKKFALYKCSVADYLKNNLSEELLDLKERGYFLYERNMEEIITISIDMGDIEVISAIEDIILGDNNVGCITTGIIRGVIKSSNEKLHKLLAKFLIAARLQEGVRQAICENADCGTKEAFITIFNAIYENDLMRFAGVKRAIATWTGICDEENMDRITAKLVKIIKECLDNKENVEKYEKSNDTIEFYMALWFAGIDDVKNACELMKKYLECGTKNQKLTISYYTITLCDDEFKMFISKKVLEEYNMDYEMLATFMKSYICNAEGIMYTIIRNKDKKVSLEEMFDCKEEARKHFNIMKNIVQDMPKNKMAFSPIIFPWYSVTLKKSEILEKMSLIAYMLQEEDMIDFIAENILSNDSISYCVDLLLCEPKTAIQRSAIIKAMSKCNEAYNIVNKLELTEDEYKEVTKMLRYKTKATRLSVVRILAKQRGQMLINFVKRAMNDKKEDIRAGALGVLLSIKEENAEECYEELEECKEILENINEFTEKEQILVNEILNKSKKDGIEVGFDIYDVNVNDIVEYNEVPKEDKDINIFKTTQKELENVFEKLEQFLELNEKVTYIATNGEECLVGNGLNGIRIYNSKTKSYDVQLMDLWKEFYEKEIKDFFTLIRMKMMLDCVKNIKIRSKKIENKEMYIKNIEKLIGEAYFGVDIGKFKKGISKSYYGGSDFYIVVDILYTEYIKTVTKEEYNQIYKSIKNIYIYILENIPKEELCYEVKEECKIYNFKYESLLDDALVNFMGIVFPKKMWEFKEYFAINKSLEKLSVESNDDYKVIKLNVFDYIKAYREGYISRDMVFKEIFENLGVSGCVEELSNFLNKTYYNRSDFYGIYGIDSDKSNITDDVMYEKVCEIHDILIEKILEVELVRGDMETYFSKSAKKIKRIDGADNLVKLLKGMGEETFERNNYYYGRDEVSKKESFSHLIQVCQPKSDDNKEVLDELLKDSKITKERLIETALFSPKWIDIIGEHLKIKGFKKCCYYFIAHMNEYCSERRMAVIAKYTSLTKEELTEGAFDFKWFKETYAEVGKENFDIIYDSAKYLTTGTQHSRARKFADSALGNYTITELEEKIEDKRNKDFVKCYTIVPIKNKKDMVHRYEFLQKFLKESKKFGAQRRTSERLAVDIAMKNMAMVTGYSDVTRLKIILECEVVNKYNELLEWHTIDKENLVEVKIEIDKNGESSIKCRKNGKNLKNIPAKYKKDEYVVLIKEVKKKFKEQNQRIIKVFEEAMEDKKTYEVDELKTLLKNPVIEPIVKKLVFIDDKNNKIGFIGEESDDIHIDITKIKSLKSNVLRVAHTYDLYKNGKWCELQKFVFENEIKQPFKQVFRELYTKLDEELEQKHSRMFAGNQIQPRKTVACLKNRRWIADYEDGLQKVFYDENIVAVMYAMADWFSPSDIEEPTLEYVEFYDRKTFKILKIKDIPDIIYSEVMRDVDLAVSVAHAGGVDPETSHSTIEMRSVIVEFNAKLFGVKNVTVEKNHAFVEGSMARYSVHLGSGVVHKIGGTQLAILPVHSQSRGKIFLPFVDEDPKTSEIISKILLLANDEKIKDPYILQQIKRD